MALITLHRVNSIEALKSLDPKYGVEVDIRHNPATDTLYLKHDPGLGDDFETYVEQAAAMNIPFVMLNIKEAGIEKRVMDIVTAKGIKDWFLLDVEFPFIYKAAHGDPLGIGGRIAIRYSESEVIEQALSLAGKFKWVWVDVNTKLPLNEESHKKLRDAGYKLALVCPERWGRPEDIPKYIEYMKAHNITVDTVMTSLAHADEWQASGVVV